MSWQATASSLMQRTSSIVHVQYCYTQFCPEYMRWTSSLMQAPGGGGCRRNEDSHQLDSSSMIEAGDGGYSGPMHASCCTISSLCLACLPLPCDALRASCYIACLPLPHAQTRKRCRIALEPAWRMSTLPHARSRRMPHTRSLTMPTLPHTRSLTRSTLCHDRWRRCSTRPLVRKWKRAAARAARYPGNIFAKV